MGNDLSDRISGPAILVSDRTPPRHQIEVVRHGKTKVRIETKRDHALLKSGTLQRWSDEHDALQARIDALLVQRNALRRKMAAARVLLADLEAEEPPPADVPGS